MITIMMMRRRGTPLTVGSHWPTTAGSRSTTWRELLSDEALMVMAKDLPSNLTQADETIILFLLSHSMLILYSLTTQ
jgi:hypothetical protein